MPASFESSLEIPGLPTTGPVLTGAITGCTITEVGGTGPGNVIRTDQNWETTIEWHLEGALLVAPFFSFEGQWMIRVYLESMGPGTEYTLPSESGSTLSVDTYASVAPDQRDYKHTVSVAAGTVAAGTYKVVVALTYESSPGNPGPIAGFHESGMVQFYTPT